MLSRGRSWYRNAHLDDFDVVLILVFNLDCEIQDQISRLIQEGTNTSYLT
jgi:hypothetical protein